jgi:diguanylate cyclase (GGDEF)-like protein
MSIIKSTKEQSPNRANLNPFTLAFQHNQQHLEAAYGNVYFKKSIKQIRFAMVLSIFVYGVFAWLDIYAVPEKTALFWFIRFALFTPLALTALVLSYTPVFEKHYQLIVSCFSIAGSAGLLVIHMIASAHGFYSYHYALVFVLLYVIYLLRLRFRAVLLSGLVIIFAYNLAQWYLKTVPPDIHLDSNLLFGFILLFGCISIYFYEALDRNQFYLQQLLEAEKEKVIEANLKLEKELEFLSYHDQLTGLHNRRYFEEELKRLDIPSKWPLTVIMSDVNGLKLINDSLGPTVGDEILKTVARILINGAGEEAVVARLGGDEFAILLPKADQSKAEKQINNLKNIAMKENVNGLDISITFGYAIKENDSEMVSVILKLAEDLMYRKKLFEGPSIRSKAIDMIIRTLYEKNKREEEHSRRVAEIAQTIGRAVNMASEGLKELETAGLLHDIGKIAIDEKVLNKEGALTDMEYAHIKLHPEIGHRILNAAYEMSDLSDYVLSHHERWDGKGYPRGICAEQIPLQSRIIAIADAYDAMTSARPYRAAKPPDFAIEQLTANAGTQFDPELVEIFVEQVLKYNKAI